MTIFLFLTYCRQEMNIEVEPLTRCDTCDTPVYPSKDMKAFAGRGKVAVKFFCHTCNKVGHALFKPEYFSEYRSRWQAHLKQQRLSDPEYIGRMVQGIRIELDAINDPNDLERVWSFGEVPRELDRWPYHMGSDSDGR